MYLMTPVFCFHLSITIFLALSLLLTALQQSYNYLVEFRIITGGGVSYLQTIGILWYVIWVLGAFVIIPLYYVSIHNI